MEVAVGAEHSAALGAAGAVWTWGSGASCGLGLPSRKEAVTAPRRVERGLPPGFRAGALALGAFHRALLGAGPGALAGAVFIFGRGESGQLGHGLAQDEPRPRREQLLKLTAGAALPGLNFRQNASFVRLARWAGFQRVGRRQEGKWKA